MGGNLRGRQSRFSDTATARAVSDAAGRVFVQMRIVRDAARHLIADIDQFEARVRALQATVEAIPEPPPPQPTPRSPPAGPASWPQILRIAELAQQLGLHRSTIYRMMH